MIRSLCFLLLTVTLLVSASVANAEEAQSKLGAVIETTKGKIELSFLPEDAPLAVANWINLARRGFFDGIPFNRVIPGFMVQGGDPQCKHTALGKGGGEDGKSCGDPKGNGGPGYMFVDEVDGPSKFDRAGAVAMANSGPNTNGSQFFITLDATPWINRRHSLFAYVRSGMDVVESTTEGDTIQHVTLNGDSSSFLQDSRVKSKIADWNAVLDRGR